MQHSNPAPENASRTERHEVIRLSERDSERFIQSVLRPPAPNARLRQAARRYRQILPK